MTTNNSSFPEEREKLLIPRSTYEIPGKDSNCPGLCHIATPWPITVVKKRDKPWSRVPSEGARRMGFCQGSATRATRGREGSLAPRKSLVLLPNLSWVFPKRSELEPGFQTVGPVPVPRCLDVS